MNYLLMEYNWAKDTDVSKYKMASLRTGKHKNITYDQCPVAF